MTQTITPKEWVLITLGGLFVVVFLNLWIRMLIGTILERKQIPYILKEEITPAQRWIPWKALQDSDQILEQHLAEHPEFDTPEFRKKAKMFKKLFKRSAVTLLILFLLMNIVSIL